MEDLKLNELQQVYGGGFDEAKSVGYQIGKTISGAIALYGFYVLVAALV